ncbi:ADP-ribosylation factor-like 2 binding protein [Neocallimastix lanati (nom. inval.)]|jgi:ADP-ribosylation factor 2-binding protein|uniref:ADP-ribosylation factor-like protein 2-binding protein n=1 Tax=Neocallimastix californiae TaxID=1754190 RepID=A0A1Y2DL08_9FUNG|nr:ADP-ribosylation factor-like 2 binding protein [Neocallimastix sp. JGI-2020a]ORY59816.1 ADP-ribosylation factor-like 2 binding protein [Neocallimastix californiae]|eukprot:ORY59816.1 ADP-ribosylation factor-like 2 binding protein [Neocallimastix californiae]
MLFSEDKKGLSLNEVTYETSYSSKDEKFDSIIGAIEDIILDDEFTTLQEKFFKENCEVFEEGEENKLIYTEIFDNYTEKIENYLDTKLKQQFSWFDMSEFLIMLNNREEEDMFGDVFDIMTSLGDFNSFKEMIMAYKKESHGEGFDLSGILIQRGFN